MHVLIALLVLASGARGDAVLLKDGTLLKGTIDYQTRREVVLAITSYTRVPIPRANVALAAVSGGEPGYSRYAEGSQAEEEGLQIAVVLFEHRRTHKIVSLVGTIHIGDAAYYRELRAILDAHDQVLYELVKGAGEDEFGELLGQLFGTMQQLLELESQKTIVNYGRPPRNWVHADLTWPQLKRKLKVERLDLIPLKEQEEMKLVLGLVEKYCKFTRRIGLSGRSASFLKRILGRKIGEDVEELMGPSDEKRGVQRGVMSRMMDFRNKRAMRVLKRKLRGKRSSFAVFYGAGHMAYFEMRLERMGFERLGTAWVTAWRVSRGD